MSEELIQIQFLSHFEELKDPRQLGKVTYPLNEILLLCICAVIAGADNWEDIEDFGNDELAFLQQFLPFANGIPSHDTLEAVFRRLDPKIFRTCFAAWTSSLQKGIRDIIAIDGKTLRHSFDEEQGAIHMVSALACRPGIVLAQEKVHEKSNEITAIPKLLELIVLNGATVTIDAMGCQREIAEKILKKGGNYVLALKGNQGMLNQDVREFLTHQKSERFRHVPCDVFETTEKGHGRIETRKCTVTNDVKWLEETHHWPGLQSIVLLESSRTVKGKTTTEERYYLSSLPMNAQEHAQTIRAHWQIENRLHWVMDVVFRDDDSRVRKDHAPENFHLIKQVALNLIRQKPVLENEKKRSVRRQRKSAGRNNSLLLRILQSS